MNFKKLLPISIVSLGMLVGCGGNDTPVGPAFPGEKEDGTHTVEITNLEALQALWYDDGAARAVEVTIKENGQEANVPQAIAQKKLSLVVEDADVAEASGMSLSPKKLSGDKKATKVAVKYYDTVKHFQIEVTHRKSAKEYGAAHDGTLADPLTNEDALLIAKAQEAEGSFADVEYYYGGKVDSFYHTPGSRTDKICSWYMAPAEENGERFEIYSCKKQDGSQWTDDDIWEGADFVAHGKMTVYKSGSNKTYETSSAIFDSASGTKPEPRKDINATVAEALTVGKALKDGQASWDNYIVTGYVVKQSGKNYFLADTKEAAADDKDMLELYGVSTDDQAKCLKEAKITVKMNLKNYHGQIENNGTMEITVLEEGKPWVVPEHTVTVAEAIAAAKELADGATSADLYNTTGVVTEVKYRYSEKYPTVSFNMVDEGAAEGAEALYVYSAPCTQEISDSIQVGVKVNVKGNLQNYVKNDAHTYELVNPVLGTITPASQKVDLTFNEESAMASWADKTAYYWNDQNWCGSNVTMVEAYEQDGAYHLAYTATGACDYGLQLFYKNGDLTEGKEYTVSAKVKVEKAASIKINIDEAASNDFEAGEERTLSIDYTEAAGKSSLKLVFKAGDAYPENNIVISEVKWVEKGGEVPPAVDAVTFNLGEDGEAAHFDGSASETYEETVGEVKLSISDGVKLYSGARDAKGNGCLKLGTGGATSSFKIAVPAGFSKVKIFIAGYKANVGNFKLNGGEELSTTVDGTAHNSNDGEYLEVEVTPVNGEVTFETTENGKRAMINMIQFIA